MKFHRIAVFALTATCALSLSACSKPKSAAWEPVRKFDLAKFEKQVDALETQALSIKDGKSLDVPALIAALPKSVTITYDTTAFDPTTGATRITGLKITPADKPDFGLQVAQVNFWNLDGELLKARLSGQRLNESAQLARRIEFTGASVFGMAGLMNPVMESYAGSIVEAMPENIATDPEITEGLNMDVRRYDLSIARVVFDDVVLRPWERTPVSLSADSEWAATLPLLQTYAALYRSIGVDTFVAFGGKFEMAMSQGDEQVALLGSFESAASRGWRGGDTDVALVRKLTFEGTFTPPPLPDEPVTPPGDALPGETTSNNSPAVADLPKPVRLGGGVDRITQQGSRFDKLMGYLAKGVFPPRTETDLLSLGVTKIYNERIHVAGHDIYSVRESTFDGSGFHWFVPTRLRLDASDAVYNIAGFVDMAKDLDPGGVFTEDETFKSVMTTLTRYGLDKPSLDFALDWTWNPKSGDAAVGLDYGLDNYMRLNFDFAGGFPTFDAVSALVPNDVSKTDQAAVGKLFETSSTLKSASLDLIDEGGLEKGFALVVDIAKAMPANPDDSGTNFLRGSSAAQLRQMASSGIYMAGTQSEKEAPGLKPLIDAFAGFVDKGGRFRIDLKPGTPVQWAAIADPGFASNPNQALDKLGVSASHTPPQAAKADKPAKPKS